MVYSLEYTKIPKVFFTPHHRRRRQQSNQGNSKCNNAIQRHCCNNLIQQWPQSRFFQQWCRFTLQQSPPTITSVHTAATRMMGGSTGVRKAQDRSPLVCSPRSTRGLADLNWDGKSSGGFQPSMGKAQWGQSYGEQALWAKPQSGPSPWGQRALLGINLEIPRMGGPIVVKNPWGSTVSCLVPRGSWKTWQTRTGSYENTHARAG
jgi:hypothetical protein